MKPVAIVKCGRTVPSVRARRGDFEDWIRAGMGLAPDETRVVAVFEGEAPGDPGDAGAVVVTGSSAMVSARDPWSERTAVWLRAVLETGTPLLGICYGHQLLAHALGAPVGRNPRGREIGTVEVTLGPEARRDPLLGDLPGRVRVQATHVESVLALPAGARLLGANEADPHHAFAVGDSAWAVQFHPEFDADVMRGYIEARAAILREEGLDPLALLARVAESVHGTGILRRFAAIARERAR